MHRKSCRDTGRRIPSATVRLIGASAALTALVAGCGGSPSRHSALPTTTKAPSPATAPITAKGTTPAAAPASKPAWIIADWAVAQLQHAALSPQLVNYFFNNASTYLIVHPGEKRVDAQLPDATRVQRFTSFVDMQKAFADGTILPGIKAIMYDNEAWSFTPANEKDQPIAYATQAEALAHAHGMEAIFTPAANLATLHASGSKYSDYLSQGLAGQGARVADVFDIQSQQAEATSEFLPFVTQAVSQARAANSHAVIMTGIGPNPGGRTVTASDIMAAYQSTRAEVAGYWLNLPAGNPQCPQCGKAQPQVAVSFLQSLAQTLGQTS